MTEETQTNEASNLLDNVDAFAGAMTAWYQSVIAKVQNYQEIPRETVLSIDDSELLLVGDAHTGFVAAMELIALELQASPPFSTTDAD